MRRNQNINYNQEDKDDNDDEKQANEYRYNQMGKTGLNKEVLNPIWCLKDHLELICFNIFRSQ